MAATWTMSSPAGEALPVRGMQLFVHTADGETLAAENVAAARINEGCLIVMHSHGPWTAIPLAQIVEIRLEPTEGTAGEEPGP